MIVLSPRLLAGELRSTFAEALCHELAHLAVHLRHGDGRRGEPRRDRRGERRRRLLGGCGPGLSGGILTLHGVGATTAHTIADVSPAVQAAVVALLGLGYVRRRRRVRRGVV